MPTAVAVGGRGGAGGGGGGASRIPRLARGHSGGARGTAVGAARALDDSAPLDMSLGSAAAAPRARSAGPARRRAADRNGSVSHGGGAQGARADHDDDARASGRAPLHASTLGGADYESLGGTASARGRTRGGGASGVQALLPGREPARGAPASSAYGGRRHMPGDRVPLAVGATPLVLGSSTLDASWASGATGFSLGGPRVSERTALASRALDVSHMSYHVAALEQLDPVDVLRSEPRHRSILRATTPTRVRRAPPPVGSSDARVRKALSSRDDLEIVNVNKWNLRTLDGVRESTSVVGMFCRENDLADLSQLDCLPELRVLDCAQNSLTSSSLSIPQGPLVFLNLSANAVSDLRCIPTIETLQSLLLGNNGIRSLVGMAVQPRLECLSLADNEIESLDGMPRLPCLQVFRVSGNPFAAHPMYREMARLAAGYQLERLDGELLPSPGSDSSIVLQRTPERYVVSMAVRRGCMLEELDTALNRSLEYLGRASLEQLPEGLFTCESVLLGGQAVEGSALIGPVLVPADAEVAEASSISYAWMHMDAFGQLEPAGETGRTYACTASDDGACMCCEITVASDFLDGEPVVLQFFSPVVRALLPSALDAALTGNASESGTLQFAVAYRGGVEGASTLRWLLVDAAEPICPDADGASAAAQAASAALAAGRALDLRVTGRTLSVSRDMIGKRVCCVYVPVRRDGVSGTPAVVLSPAIQAAPPSIESMRIEGKPIESATLTLTAQYCGGTEGASQVRWYRRASKTDDWMEMSDESGHRTVVLRKLHVGSMLRVTYTPYNNHGVAGRTVELVTGTIHAAPPQLTALRVMGKLIERYTLRVEAEYFGGDEGDSEVQWFRRLATPTATPAAPVAAPSSDAGDGAPAADTQAAPAQPAASSAAASAPLTARDAPWELIAGVPPNALEYTLEPGDIGHHIRVVYVPHRSDGAVGVPVECATGQTVRPDLPTAHRLQLQVRTMQEARFRRIDRRAPLEFEILGFKYSYTGGREGSSEFLWQRIHPDGRVEDVGHDASYAVTREDTACVMRVSVRPRRVDGEFGEWARIESLACEQLDPMVDDVEVIGDCFEGSTLYLKYNYRGGYEGETRIRWFRQDASAAAGDSTGAELVLEQSKQYQVTGADAQKRLFVEVTPVRNDGKTGAMRTATTQGSMVAQPPRIVSVTMPTQQREGEEMAVDFVYSGGMQGTSRVVWSRLHVLPHEVTDAELREMAVGALMSLNRASVFNLSDQDLGHLNVADQPVSRQTANSIPVSTVMHSIRSQTNSPAASQLGTPRSAALAAQLVPAGATAVSSTGATPRTGGSGTPRRGAGGAGTGAGAAGLAPPAGAAAAGTHAAASSGATPRTHAGRLAAAEGGGAGGAAATGGNRRSSRVQFTGESWGAEVTSDEESMLSDGAAHDDGGAADASDDFTGDARSVRSLVVGLGKKYTPELADVGRYLMVTIVPVRADDVAGDIVFELTRKPVEPAAPRGVSLRVDGVAVEGQSLVPHFKYYGGQSSATQRFQWRRVRDGAVVGDKREYVPTTADFGSALRVRWTPVRADGAEGDPLEADSAPVEYGKPMLTSAVASLGRDGDCDAHVTYTYAGGNEGAHDYEWQREQPAAEGAAAPSSSTWATVLSSKSRDYTISCADYQRRLRCIVTPRRSDGVAGAPFTSEPTAPVTFQYIRALQGLTISRPATETLESRVSAQTQTGYGGTVSFQWVLTTDKGERTISKTDTFMPRREHIGCALRVVATPSWGGETGDPLTQEFGTVLPGPPKFVNPRLAVSAGWQTTSAFSFVGTFVGGEPGFHQYQWYRQLPGNAGVAFIGGATERIYHASPDDLGCVLLCVGRPVRTDGTVGDAYTARSDVITDDSTVRQFLDEFKKKKKNTTSLSLNVTLHALGGKLREFPELVTLFLDRRSAKVRVANAKKTMWKAAYTASTRFFYHPNDSLYCMLAVGTQPEATLEFRFDSVFDRDVMGTVLLWKMEKLVALKVIKEPIVARVGASAATAAASNTSTIELTASGPGSRSASASQSHTAIDSGVPDHVIATVQPAWTRSTITPPPTPPSLRSTVLSSASPLSAPNSP